MSDSDGSPMFGQAAGPRGCHRVTVVGQRDACRRLPAQGKAAAHRAAGRVPAVGGQQPARRRQRPGRGAGQRQRPALGVHPWAARHGLKSVT